MKHGFTFCCSHCQTEMTVTFKTTVTPEQLQEFAFCCMACLTRYRVANWQPLYIVRDLSLEKSLEKSQSQ